MSKPLGIFLIGGPGSGKDYVLNNIFARFDLTEVQVDHIINGAANELLEQNKNIVINGALDEEKIKVAASLLENYNIDYVYVSVTNKVSRLRNSLRENPIAENKRIDKFLKAEKLAESIECFRFNNSINLNESSDFEKVFFADQIEKLLSRLLEHGLEMQEVSEAKTFAPVTKHKSGLPKKYVSGLSDKTAAARKAHWKKMGKLSDRDPRAYKPAPGDATAKTKLSQYTKKYREMYGEAVEDEKPLPVKLRRARRSGNITAVMNKRREIGRVDEGAADKALAAKAEKSGVSLRTLKAVFRRGVAAWNSGHRPGTTPQQWGHARVNSYITKGKTYHTADKDLRGEGVEYVEEDRAWTHEDEYGMHMDAHADAMAAGKYEEAERHAKKAEAAAAKHFKVTGEKIKDAGYIGNSEHIIKEEVDINAIFEMQLGGTQLLEYLTPAQQKKFSKHKMSDAARSATDHFFGVGNDRVEEEIDNSHHDKSEPHKKVEAHIGKELTKDEYKSGLTSDKYGRQVKLSKLIKDPQVQQEFARDNTRAGVKAVKKVKMSIVRGVHVAGQTNSAPDAQHPTGHSWSDESCKNVETGSNKNYLQHEIKHGTVAVFAHDHNGKEIYRATLQPHHNEAGDTVYLLNSEYGIKNAAFTAHAHNVASRLSGSYKPGMFTIHNKVYDDSNLGAQLHPNATAEHISAALKDKSEHVRSVAIRHPNATVDHITTALKDENERVRAAAIRHPNATAEHISAALRQGNGYTRQSAIEHPKATAEHITAALKDEDRLVRRAAIQHPNATVDHINTALKDKEERVRGAAIRHPKATAEHITAALKDESEHVRSVAIQHPNATVDHITTALKDEDKNVRMGAIQHPNATVDHITTASKDKDVGVRELAKRRLNRDFKTVKEQVDINAIFEMQLVGTDEYRKYAIAMTPGQGEIENAFPVKNPNKKPVAVVAKRGESIVSQYEEHTECGTPNCCGECESAKLDGGGTSVSKFTEGKEKDGKEDGVDFTPTANVKKLKKGDRTPGNMRFAYLDGLPVVTARVNEAGDQSKSGKTLSLIRKSMSVPRQVPAPPGGHPVPPGYKRVKDHIAGWKLVKEENTPELTLEEAVQYHLENKVSFTENVFRPGSDMFFQMIDEAKKLYSEGKYTPKDEYEVNMLKSDIGEIAEYEGQLVVLDYPIEEGLEEACWSGYTQKGLKKKGNRMVPNCVPVNEEDETGGKGIGKPWREGGGGAVYVRDGGSIRKIRFSQSGMKKKFMDPAATRSFVARHHCLTNKDKTSASYWACRYPRFFSNSGKIWW